MTNKSPNHRNFHLKSIAMKTDRYTRVILTCIAFLLAALFLQNSGMIKPASAQTAYECNDLETLCEKLDNLESHLEEVESNTYGYYCGNCPE